MMATGRTASGTDAVFLSGWTAIGAKETGAKADWWGQVSLSKTDNQKSATGMEAQSYLLTDDLGRDQRVSAGERIRQMVSGQVGSPIYVVTGVPERE